VRIVDSLYRAIGLTSPSDVEDAAAERLRTRLSDDPMDMFVASVADGLHDRPRGEVMRVMTSADVPEKWPRDRDMRWAAVAQGARDMSLRFEYLAKAGAVDASLEGEVKKTIMDTASRTFDGSGLLGAHVSRTQMGVSENIRRILRDGESADRVSADNARALIEKPDARAEAILAQQTQEFVRPVVEGEGREQWLREATRVQLAMARKGMLSPKAVVELAMSTADNGPSYPGRVMPIDRGVDQTLGARRMTIEQETGVVREGRRPMPSMDFSRMGHGRPSAPGAASGPMHPRGTGADVVDRLVVAHGDTTMPPPAPAPMRLRSMAAMAAASQSR